MIPQWYVDMLTVDLPEDTLIDIITGSEVEGNVIPSTKHDSNSFFQGLNAGRRYLRLMKKWMKNNKDKHYNLIFAVLNPVDNYKDYCDGFPAFIKPKDGSSSILLIK